MFTLPFAIECAAHARPCVIAEWAVTAPAKAGGVAPQWTGKPPHKPLTPERCFLEDRRATLLREKPDLKLLTCEFTCHFPSMLAGFHLQLKASCLMMPHFE